MTSDLWDEIQKRRPAKRFIQSEEDGTVRVKFESELYITEKGDKDILGFVWEKEWNKVECKVTILAHRDTEHVGLAKIYSLGGDEWSPFNDFITICKRNEITPELIPGCVFDITVTAPFEREYIYLGRNIGGEVKIPEPSLKIESHTLEDATEALKTIKEKSPELSAIGYSQADFLKMLTIRAHIKSLEGERILPDLIKNNVIKVDGDTIHII